MRPLALAPLILAVLLSPFSKKATGEVYTVSPDGTGDFPTIQSAIDAAEDGDVLELTDGTFAGDGNRDIFFRAIALTVRSRSGDPTLCVIDCDGSGDDPHRGIIFDDGVGPEGVLEAVSIVGGWTPYVGGGVFCHGSPTIRHCVLSHNYAFDKGGGIYCDSDAAPTIDGCIVSDNSAYRYGGGMHCESASPVLIDSRFSTNAAVFGAGMCSDWYSSLTLAGCVFSGNYSNAGSGGAMFCYTSSITLTDCIFSDNPSVLGPMVVFCDRCSFTLTDCTLTGNSPSGTCGGLECLDSSGLLENCTFSGISGYGYGVALRCDSSSPVLANCTFTGNSGTVGGTISCEEGASPTLKNTIIASNSGISAVYCLDEQSAPSLICCDLFGNEIGDWVGCIADQYGINGNISDDPLFCDPENGDLKIRSDSPCAPFSPPNEQCDLIGAWPVGCEPPVLVEQTTWGRVKAAYRR